MPRTALPVTVALSVFELPGSVDWSALQIAYEFLHAHHHFWSTRLDALVDYTQSQGRARKRTPHE